MKPILLKAILFDLDGVLANTVELHYRSWKKILSVYTIPFSRQENEKLRGLTRSESLAVILGNNDLLPEQKKAILQQKNTYFKKELACLGPESILPGVKEIINEAKAAGIRMSVASASRNTKPVLERLGLLEQFEFIADSNHIHNSKPAPDVFLYAAHAMRVCPDECLVLEDSEVGVEAGLRAGMCVIGLGPRLRVGHATNTFEDLCGIRLSHLLGIYEQWYVNGNILPHSS